VTGTVGISRPHDITADYPCGGMLPLRVKPTRSQAVGSLRRLRGPPAAHPSPAASPFASPARRGRLAWKRGRQALERPSAWALLPRAGRAGQVSSAAIRLRSSPTRSRSALRGKRAVQQDLAYRRQTARIRVVVAFDRSLFGKRLFAPTDRATDQTVGRDPSRVPTFEGLSAYLALKAGDLAGLRHGFGTAIDRAACTGSMAAF
jgi:hypothetical protein